MVNFVDALNFFQDRNDQTDRHELAELVDEVKRCVVNTVPAYQSHSTLEMLIYNKFYYTVLQL